ncbi:Ig-like domain-containing protein [Neptunicella marina]|uniref:Fibronectin type-III domain-containing protein n=1 Tax=Neptunicella marina TaxID=2125989 RepID=A0A8J6IV05_9ALTE|nr:Ig-like domain-containing protein [Neptunicella marina]MBC3766714.1 hypothetical protein [Neptunicella marina]
MIGDYNGDGFDDVISFGQTPGKPVFVHFSSDKGHFSANDLHQLPTQIGGVDWNTSEHSLFNRKNTDGKGVDVVRNNNAIGGLDEEGNVLDDQGNIAQLSLDELNSEKCRQLAYSPEVETVETTCAPQYKDAVAGGVTTFAVPIDEDEPPPTPVSSPMISGGSYHAVNESYTVTAPSVPGAEDYLHYESTNNSSYTSVGGYGKSFSTSQSSYGYRYYKYKVCNINGCSGYSPYIRIFIYTTPSTVNNFGISSTSINYGQSVTLSWTKSGGLISSGFYQKKEVSPSGSERNFSNTSQGSGTNFSFSATPSSGAGTYTYKVRACNPNNLCGGWQSKTVSVSIPNTPPTISNIPNQTMDMNQSKGPIGFTVGDLETPAGNLTLSKSTSNATLLPTSGISFVGGSGANRVVTLTPNAGQFGTATINITVKDGGNLTASDSFTVTVVPNAEPTVSPSSPTNGASYLTTDNVTASASASDSDGSIAHVAFKLDSGSWQVDTSSPYSVDFGTLSAGSHTISYRAKDNDGAYSTVTSRSFTVEAQNLKPTVSPSSPTNGASYLTTDNVTASASASDSDGSIAHVAFKLDSGSWQVDTSSPYSVDFGTLSAGSHTISYRAKDNDGTYSTVTSRSFTVEAPQQTGRRVVFIHTDLLGSPAAETDQQGNAQ